MDNKILRFLRGVDFYKQPADAAVQVGQIELRRAANVEIDGNISIHAEVALGAQNRAFAQGTGLQKLAHIDDRVTLCGSGKLGWFHLDVPQAEYWLGVKNVLSALDLGMRSIAVLAALGRNSDDDIN